MDLTLSVYCAKSAQTKVETFYFPYVNAEYCNENGDYSFSIQWDFVTANCFNSFFPLSIIVQGVYQNF